jgi:hypothetical protein
MHDKHFKDVSDAELEQVAGGAGLNILGSVAGATLNALGQFAGAVGDFWKGAFGAAATLFDWG